MTTNRFYEETIYSLYVEFYEEPSSTTIEIANRIEKPKHHNFRLQYKNRKSLLDKSLNPSINKTRVYSNVWMDKSPLP